MGEGSTIEWTDHTFNAWIGCTKVSPGCTNCYAESYASRYGRAKWGPGQPRSLTSAANWRKPYSWNRKAEAEGVRRRVFCASLADLFDHEADGLMGHSGGLARDELFDMITLTPSLDWLLLTKRPENVRARVPASWLRPGGWPPNAWLGTTVEDQRRADERIPVLLDLPAPVRFLSCEPLLGPVDLTIAAFNGADSIESMSGIGWVIAGGESGPGARPMHPSWARSLRDQCGQAGVPFLFKQWGEFAPGPNGHATRPGKHAAGRVLDGRLHDEVPRG